MLNYSANGPSGYNLTNSLRLRRSASASLARTPSSTGNQQKFTWSGWIKLGVFSSAPLFGSGTQATLADYFTFFSTGSNQFQVNMYLSGFYGSVWTPVFRDPSAWYHFVIAVDTTQATAANRINLYVNGVLQLVSPHSSGYIPQNTNIGITKSSVPTYIGTDKDGNFYDGYMTEINFIDGQALTPSSFGSTNSTTGVWQPAKYTGTYGTNGFYLPFNKISANGFSSYYGSFSGSGQYISAPNNAAWNFGTGDFTIEGWYYINNATDGSYQLFGCDNGSGSVPKFVAYTNGSNEILFDVYFSGLLSISTTGSAVKPLINTWAHIAVVKSSSVTTIYVNGIPRGSASDTKNYTGLTQPFYIGYIGEAYQNNFKGYISNFRVVKGSAVYTAPFNPPTSALTAITNTQLLTLQNSTLIDNSTNAFTITNTGSVTTTLATVATYNALSSDQSGNANNWIQNNISLIAGTTYDSMTDVPTLTSATVANYAVLNPISKTAGTLVLSSANLKLGDGLAVSRCNSTMQVSSGKWYFETTLTVAGSNTTVGIGQGNITDQYPGQDALSYAQTLETASSINNNTQPAYGTALTTGDIFMCAFDLDNNKLFFGKNGTWFGSSNPATGANPVYTLTAGSYGAIARPYTTGATIDINFGQRPFAYTPPTGFVALNTFNLPSSTIPQGNKYMDATIYTGNSATPRIITNTASFKPDLVWIKNRSNGYSHNIYDSVRGSGSAYSLQSDNTNNESTNASNTALYGYLSAFNSNGFSTTNGTDPSFPAIWANQSSQTYVGWQWQAGQGSTSSNTSGSITSTVSVNTTAGFSVVTYTGTGANATVGHGLGVAPKMVIVKNRTAGSTAWNVYQASIPSGNLLSLNSTAASFSSANRITAVSSTTFSIGADSDVNGSTNSHVAYCWAEIAGFSKFTSFTGNGSSDGVFVYLGFMPKYIMIKSTSIAGEWAIYDIPRDLYNPMGLGGGRLQANTANAETGADSAQYIDFLSNGFKIRNASGFDNQSGATYIVAAFASNPFKNSNAF